MLDQKRDSRITAIDVLKFVFGPEIDWENITLARCREMFLVAWEILEIKTTQDADKITELQNLNMALQKPPNEFEQPPYGMLPVPAEFYERIVELSQRRGISVGMLMQKDDIHRHLMLLLEKELL